MHIDPDRVGVVAGRHFAQIEFDRVKRLVNAAVVADVFQNAVDQADDAAFAADVRRRARIAGGIFDWQR